MTTMDELSNAETFPEVKQNAIDAVRSAAQEELELAKKQGFDPSIHRVDASGKPVRSKNTGAFLKVNGRKAGGKNTTGEKPHGAQGQKSFVYGQTQPQAVGPDGKPVVRVDSTSAAKTVSGLLEQATIVLISDEWKLEENERQKNVEAWRDCFDYYGGVQLPPPQALILNHLTIIATRAFQPKTQTKWERLKYWAYDRFTKFRMGKKKDAHSDHRTDTLGEDNIREKETSIPEENGDQINRT